MSRSVRVAHLISHPIQYYVPVYRALSAFPDIDLTVYYLTDTGIDRYFDPGFGSELRWDVDLLSGYTWEILPSARGRSPSDGLRQGPQMDIVRSLSRGAFDVIWAHGYRSWTTLAVRGLALLRRQAFMMRDDQTLLEPRSRLARAAKRAIFGYLFLDSKSRALYPGVNSREHFVHFGVPNSKLRPAVHCVDDTLFSQALTALRPQRDALRNAFGIPNGVPVILFCGKLIEKKDPAVLLEAFARMRLKHDAWLMMVGDGPLMPELLAMRDCYEPSVRHSILFAGFFNQSRMPEAYTVADIFVLPSREHETWGLVVNEALQFSLPIVASDHVGCVPDLVCNNVNGFVFERGSVDALTDCLTRLVANPELRRTFGQRGRDLVAHYTVDACANQIRAACLEVASS